MTSIMEESVTDKLFGGQARSFVDGIFYSDHTPTEPHHLDHQRQAYRLAGMGA